MQPDPGSTSAPAVLDQPVRIPAVQRCCQAREHSLRDSKSRRRDSYDTCKLAVQAYRNAMPDLCGYENIRDFIACTSYGMVLGAISTTEGTKFLYAAQVALGALHREPKTKPRADHPAAPESPSPAPAVDTPPPSTGHENLAED